ncbi:hypothetical protein X755_04740 [Mesorhizobium sp. LNJC405B00]|nr:hypothetical protein X766_13485 [Mesorhizobium sp. LSJC255A00]ESY01439.1 hypothetical protein X755_04740 [Mesorhizobium sp. LNJC405B00]
MAGCAAGDNLATLAIGEIVMRAFLAPFPGKDAGR